MYRNVSAGDQSSSISVGASEVENPEGSAAVEEVEGLVEFSEVLVLFVNDSVLLVVSTVTPDGKSEATCALRTDGSRRRSQTGSILDAR